MLNCRISERNSAQVPRKCAHHPAYARNNLPCWDATLQCVVASPPLFFEERRNNSESFRRLYISYFRPIVLELCQVECCVSEQVVDGKYLDWSWFTEMVDTFEWTDRCLSQLL